MTQAQESPTYRVTVERRSAQQAQARARDHVVMLNVKKGDGNAGFNAAETLLAALGTCLLTNVNALAEKMHLRIDGARVEIEAVRRDEPPALERIAYRLVLESPEPDEKLRRLHALAVHWGTVTNTLVNGIVPQGELIRESATGPSEAAGAVDV